MLGAIATPATGAAVGAALLPQGIPAASIPALGPSPKGTRLQPRLLMPDFFIAK